MPLGASLRNQLETQDTVLGQEHVLLENVHSLNTLLTQLFGESMITMEILLQWTTHDCTESVCGESTRQHTDITERTLQRLVQNVTNLVFEILGCHERVDQVSPTLTQHGVNFTTSTSEILVVVEGLPQGQK